ncbi:MAG: tetratricopeptide repeat protein [Kiritimatiellia bacterium]
MKDIRYQKLLSLCTVVLISIFLVSQGMAQAESMDPELKTELTYIKKLQQMRMPDIAEAVIEETRKKFPEASAQLKVQEIQGLLWQGKWDEVQKIIDGIKDKNSAEYWALVLSKADALYAFQKYEEADKLYKRFFTKVAKPTPELASFYRDSAYKYAQMLLYLGKESEALDAYRRLVNNPKIKLEEGQARNVYAEMAELMLKLVPETKDKKEKTAMLKEAEGIVDKLLWKQDVWFGKAIVMKAHIAVFRNDIAGAQELVENYLPQLKIIHDSLLKEDPDGSRGWLRMSPMPQCRYLLAKLLLDEAKAEMKKDNPDEELIKSLFLGERDPETKKRKGNGALNHFLNVFLRFPESKWAAAAGAGSEEVRNIIEERYGVSVGVTVTPERMAKVREMQFKNANVLFSRNQYKKAIDSYLQVLNQFPESRESVKSLYNLVVCYLDTAAKNPEDQRMADMITAHLSERFCKKEDLMKLAGDKVRQIGDLYGEMKRADKRSEVYAMFFRDYPDHYAASQLIMSFADRAYKNENYPGAMNYYQRIVNEYPGSPYYIDALNRITRIHKAKNNVTNEMSSLEFLIGELEKTDRPGHNLPVAVFRLAETRREYGSSLMKKAAASTNDTVEAVQKTGMMNLIRAAKGFDRVFSMLKGDGAAAYQRNADETQRNAEICEMAAFTKGIALAQLQYPKNKIETFRKLSINAFEDYLKAYPDGKYAPRSQLQIGTLYTIMTGAAEDEAAKAEYTRKAQEAFEKLSKKYLGSEEARNSVPMLADALMDMGLRGEAVAKYREMFTVDGSYNASQYMKAADALLASKEYPLALQGYNKVLDDAKELSVKAAALIGKARASLGQKKYAVARKILEDFVNDEKLSRLTLVVEANMLLVEAASEMGKTEADDDLRKDLFNQAIDALKVVKGHRKEKAEIAEIDLATGDVLVRKMKAEEKLGLKEQMVESRGKAIVAYMSLIDRIDPGDAELTPYLEKAYHEFVPLLLEHEAYEQAAEDCQTYLKLFPEGKYKTDIQNWLNQAQIEL